MFNYFGNKEQLFYYIVEYAIDQFARHSAKEIVNQSDDLFERLKERGYRKLKTALKYPKLYSILYRAFLELDDDMKKRSYA